MYHLELQDTHYLLEILSTNLGSVSPSNDLRFDLPSNKQRFSTGNVKAKL